MRHLIARDLRLLAPFAWLIAPGHLLWCVQAFLVPELYFWMSLAAALGWTVAMLMIDWQLETDRMTASLPVTRADIVKARYVSALGGVAIGAAFYVAYGHAVMAVAGERLIERWSASPAWASGGGVCAFAIVGYALVIGFLPFYFCFGFPLGASWFAVSATVLVSAAAGLARLVGPAARLADTPGATAAGLPPSEAVRAWLAVLAAAWGLGPALLAVLAGAAALGALSVRLSTGFYRRREL